ncbi:nitrogenase molybdenum-iron protein alpha chain [Bacillota bacterium LX-D]|nr:nitrogenase molybdenum-iron protein alpha chain [Bacillota bacterium LX-D]
MLNEKTLDKILDSYPAKVRKNRKQHMLVKKGDAEKQEIAANTRTIPGIITNRGCCYAGCKGVVIGPLMDMVHIVHGPIGCSYYAWGTRRNKAKPERGEKNFINYAFSTDLQESDIVFGGEKKLKKAIQEAVETFNPAAITISATCPVGLIGDDISAVAAEAQKKYGIPVIAFNCEGYKGVSQSAGHHIANNNLMREVIGKGIEEPKEFSINVLGEYNIGGDEWEISRVLKKIGYNIVAVMTGNSSYERLKNAHTAQLNLVQCHRSINYIAEMIEVKYGTPWLKVNFIGIQSTIESLRNMALYFGDERLKQRTEEVIAEELADIRETIEKSKALCEGKKVMLFVGGSRAHHYQSLFKDLGMETVMAGYEFAHRDDYEGRAVLPFLKPDADSKNIEEYRPEKDEKHYKIYVSKERMEQLKKIIPLGDYEGMIKTMGDGTIVIDDLNHFETEEFIKAVKPDIFCSGIKDKYTVQKMGVFSKQLHSYDYGGPYAGFKGAVNFANDIIAGMYTPTWSYLVPPWKSGPYIEGTFANQAEMTGTEVLLNAESNA